MSAFSITCTTCRRRLRVSSVELVGEILACPKCGGMVLVTPPESDTPDTEKNPVQESHLQEPHLQEPSAAPIETSEDIAAPPRPAAEASYDSTEVMITESSSPATPTKEATPPPTETGRKTHGSFRFPDSVVVPAPPGGKSTAADDSEWAETVDDIERPEIVSAPPESEITLSAAETTSPPPSEWETSRSPNNLRRILTMAGLGVLGAVLAIGLLAFVASRNSPEEEPVAATDTPNGASRPEANAGAAAKTSPENTAGSQTEVDSEEIPHVVQAPPHNQESSTEHAPGESPTEHASAAASTTPPLPNSATTSDPVSPALPPAAEAAPTPPENQGETKSLRALDDLLDFLDTETPPPNVPSEPSSTHETPSVVSTGRLLPPPVDVAAMLGMQVKQIDFPDTPLLVFLEFIQELTTAPITVDASVLAVAGVRPTTPVRVKLADVTVGETLRAALEPLTLAYVVQEGNILITPWRESPEQAYDSQTYDVAALLQEDSKSRNEFVARLKRLMHPGSWTAEGVQIKINNDQLVVTNTETVQWEVGLLLERIRHVRKNANGAIPSWAAAVERGRERLAKPLRLNYSRSVLLTTILARLREISGAQFLVDWRSAYTLGVTPDVEASFLAEDQPQGKTLTATLSPLGLAYRVVDEEIIEIASPESLAQKLRVEAYAVVGLSDDSANMQAFQEKLAQFLARLPKALLERTSALELDRHNGCVWACLNDAQHAEFAAEIKSLTPEQ